LHQFRGNLMKPSRVPTLIGIRFDASSSYLRGAAGAPAKIREALHCAAGNRWTENGTDLGAPGVYEDAGDLEFGNGQLHNSAFHEVQSRDSELTTREFKTKDAFAEIESRISELLTEGRRPISLGGDHSITFPVVKAFAGKYSNLTIFHFDAHPDLYDEFEGNGLSHACPFARIMEAGLAKRLVQIGIRTATGHQREQARKFGVEMMEMKTLPAFERLKADGPVYVSFDIDVLDPAFAPGVSHREPGGMSVREAVAHLQAIQGEIVGADIVEYNPVQDIEELTAGVAAKILKEILGKMIAQ
jgi:arginase